MEGAGGPAPVLLFGYGTYGVTIDAAFDATRLGLLERGFVDAIAHVRGGQALGREWYEQGRGLQKIHTFQDFVDVGRFLVESGRTSPDRLFARGKSAGGATVGASPNMAPDLFRGAVLEVPALDIVTSMLDPTIPLVTGEYEEWGDPRRREEYASMLAWSPYDTLRESDYPRVLVLAGFQDRQVMYWEPAKWVAKLRAVAAEGRAAPDPTQIKVFILVLISSVNESMLFGHLRPVRTLQLRDEEFVEELSQVLGRYLGAG